MPSRHSGKAGKGTLRRPDAKYKPRINQLMVSKCSCSGRWGIEPWGKLFRQPPLYLSVWILPCPHFPLVLAIHFSWGNIGLNEECCESGAYSIVCFHTRRKYRCGSSLLLHLEEAGTRLHCAARERDRRPLSWLARALHGSASPERRTADA